MPESTSQRVTRAYRRGYLDALRQATLDTKAQGDMSTALYLAKRAEHFELNGVPGKGTI